MIANDPNKRFWFPVDVNDKEGPALQCRYGSCREFEAYEDELNTASTISSNREAVKAYLTALSKFVVGSRGLGDNWQDGVKDKLTWGEIWTLCYGFTGAAALSEVDLKKSGLASPTNTAVPAESAQAAAK